MNKNLLVALIVGILSFSSSALLALPSDSTKVLVIDENSKPVAAIEVLVEGFNKIKTNQNGVSSLYTPKKLLMPFDVEIESKFYEIDNFSYDDLTGLIEITVKKILLANKEVFVTFVKPDFKPYTSLSINYLKDSYMTNAKGQIILPYSKFNPDGLIIQGMEVNKVTSFENTYTVTLSPVEQDKDFDLALANLSQSQLNDLSFKKYQIEFEIISNDIIKERVMLVESNNKIRSEIELITKRLQNEKNLTTQQRAELRNFIGNLEQSMVENSEAYKRSERKALALINKMRDVVVQRDSINLATINQLKLLEKKRIETEKANHRTILIVSFIALILLLVALIFLFIVRKIKKQKNELATMNEELTNTQKQLSENFESLSWQKSIIEEQNKQLDMFVYKASHDMKGPLKSIAGLCNIATVTVKDNNSLELFEHINKSVLKLDNFVSDLLVLAKATNSEVVIKEIKLKELIDEVVKSFKNFDGFQKINIENKIDPNLIFKSDYNLSYSILQNFIENGIKYYDDSKNVSYLRINAEKQTGEILITFEDNGLGIEDEHLPKIFDMFFKINPKSEGSGLGLHIAKYGIEKLRGRVNSRSKKGEGSTFELIFKNQ